MKINNGDIDEIKDLKEALAGRFDLNNELEIKKLSLVIQYKRNLLLEKRNRIMSEAFGTWTDSDLCFLEAIAVSLGYNKGKKNNVIDAISGLEGAILEMKNND